MDLIYVIFVCNIMGIILRFQILLDAVLLRKTLYETIDNIDKSILFCIKIASCYYKAASIKRFLQVKKLYIRCSVKNR
jgi:hypothetical protein